MTSEELSLCTEQNTVTLRPVRSKPIEAAIMELVEGDEGTLTDASSLFPVNLYVLANEKGINGASCLLYKDVLKNFAAQVDDDLVILPSSIHEVLLAPYKKAPSLDALNEMIFCINRSELPVEDRLSDHIYSDSREQNCLYLPPNLESKSSVPGGTMNPQ